MPANSFGRIFQIATFGESHGPAIGVVVDGVPPGIPLTEADIQVDLDRRRPGQSKITTQRKEADKVEILSGVFEGHTTGTPVALLIRNEDQRSKDYSNIKDVFRPGHADYTYFMKYGIRDYRGGGRSSGRETACRVAAGAIAKKILAKKKIKIYAHTKSVADIVAEKVDLTEIEKNIVRTADKHKAEAMIHAIEQARKDGDSLGGVIEAVVKGVPAGWGEPCFDKLDAMLAHALMSIATIKGFEIGDGFAATQLRGSQNNDIFTAKGKAVTTLTNHAGGILGGISNGQDLVMRVAVKPPSSITKHQDTVTTKGSKTNIQVKGRHDPCLCPRVVPVVEAMIALTLVDAMMIHQAVSG